MRAVSGVSAGVTAADRPEPRAAAKPARRRPTASEPATSGFTADEIAQLHERLLGWYERVKRDLPWRRTRDPYAIWISEVMLQQTRVETVKPYWARFLARFPTVQSLAGAPLDDVLAHWSGLGYYARGRKLHEAAQAIVARHGGALPADAAALAALPGFGPYTTAAVASIGLGLDEAAVDGNVARVLTRWLCREGDPREAKAMAFFRAVAQELLPAGSAGAWNQAMMELGATLCGPRAQPACLTCPVASLCRAHRAGRQGELPPSRKAKARPQLHLAAAYVVRGDELLLARRPDAGLFASLWELPAVEGSASDLARAVGALLGAPATVREELGTVQQTLTHRELTITVHAVDVQGGSPRAAAPWVDARFTDPAAELPGGLSSATRKALRAARSG